MKNHLINLIVEANVENTFGEAVKRFFMQLLYGDEAVKYKDFSFANPLVTYRILILAIGIGFIISSCVMFYKRHVLGELIRALLREGADAPESAKTLSELGLETVSPTKMRLITASLRSGTLRRMVCCVERDEHDEKMRALIDEVDKKGSKGKAKKVKMTEYVPQPTKDRYYLQKDKAEKLEKLFSVKGSGAKELILSIVFCVVAVALLLTIVPHFLEMWKGAL
ncbi:MAG: hypothetical protein IKT56_03160 [Clostridia bacterium]|nr:hypothetical protein [Clostridia bacterium]